MRQFFISNRWWGKLLGCFFGYLMAGPIGALFGLLIGNFFDKGLTTHFSRLSWSQYAGSNESRQNVYLEVLYSSMGHLAKASGRVSENHINLAEQVMNELFLTKKQKTLAKKYFNEGKKTTFNLSAMTDLLKTTYGDQIVLLKIYLDLMYRTVQVDGLTTKKLQLLDSLFKEMGFSPLYQQYRFHEDLNNRYHYRSTSQQEQNRYDNKSGTAARSSNNDPYTLLGLTPNANKQEVKSAYRRLIARNHPDKLIAQGLPEEMIKKANDKTQAITKAYKQICLWKGW